MAQAMSASGLAPERAHELARVVEARLAERRQPRVDVAALRTLAEEVLRETEGDQAVRRYRNWHRLDRLDRPLVVMIGGAAGVGKSTVATMLAHRLGITRVIATDVIRQVLRAFFTHEAMPSVHHSAFEVGPGGFREQADLVGTAVAAIVERAGAERTPLVVEGVHAVPGALPPEACDQCLVVEILLAVADEDLHRGHFSLRGAARPAERYLAAFDAIRELQADLERRARDAGVAVLYNEGADAVLRELMGIVLDAVDGLEDG